MSNDANFACPHCGSGYQLTPEYVAQYGGQQTTCLSCGRAFDLPTSMPAAAPFVHAGAGWAAAAPANIPLAGAAPDGAPPFAGPAPTLQYAHLGGWSIYTPGVWRDGDTIVAHSGATLPYCCVKCGGAAVGPSKMKKFWWHHPGLFALAFSPVIYAIVALCIRKQGSASFALCAAHRRSKRNGVLGACTLMGLSLIPFGVAIVDDWSVGAAVGLLLLVSGLIWLVIATKTLRPRKIEGQFLYLKGAGETFLMNLPPLPASTYGMPVRAI